jgi:uncharacterized membrane-anchored protein
MLSFTAVCLRPHLGPSSHVFCCQLLCCSPWRVDADTLHSLALGGHVLINLAAAAAAAATGVTAAQASNQLAFNTAHGTLLLQQASGKLMP